jgi:hypothetical protein
MRQDFGIECIDHKGRFRLTCRLPGAGLGLMYGELIVQDTRSGAHLTLTRDEWRPLLKSILQLVKAAEGIVADLPIDPVTLAAWQIPVRSLASALGRAHLIKLYNEDLKQLQARYIERAEATTARLTGQAKS